MYKFFGTPLKEILSKTTHKVMFRFDTKGEFITDDPEIIKRALGFFDYIEMKAESVGNKVAKTHTTPAMTITTNNQEKPETETPDEETIRALAKEKGIKNWHNKKIENLLIELKEGK
jgi:hypothetical protein